MSRGFLFAFCLLLRIFFKNFCWSHFCIHEFIFLWVFHKIASWKETIYFCWRVIKNCLKCWCFRSLLYYCTSCSRGFDLSKKNNKTVSTEETKNNEDQKSREISGLFFIRLFSSVLKQVSLVWSRHQTKKKRSMERHERLLSSHHMEPEFDSKTKILIKLGIHQMLNEDF